MKTTATVPRRRLRHFAYFLLPALLLRALVPAGYMPGSGTGFGITMQLCMAEGLRTVVVYPDGAIETEAPARQFVQHCDFALGAGSGPVPDLPNVSVTHASLPGPASSFARVIASTPCPRTQSPRAPPAHA